MKSLMIFSFILLLAVLPYSVNAYQISISDANLNTSSNPVTTDAPSWFVDTIGASCNITISSQATITGSNFEYSGSYRSPGDSLVTNIGTLSGQNAFTCRGLGSSSPLTAAGTNGTLEARARIEHSGTSGQLFATNSLSCAGSDFISFFVDNTNFTTVDNKGFQSNGLIGTQQSSNIAASVLVRNATICQDPTITPTYNLLSAGNNFGFAQTTPFTAGFFIPFNSSDSGSFNLTANETTFCLNSGGGTYVADLILVRASTESEEILDPLPLASCTGAGNFHNHFITESKTGLVPNELYYLVFFIQKGSGLSADSITMDIDFINLTIDSRIPSFECGEFSECLNGTKTRTCIDTSGQFIDKIEAVTCTTPGTFSELNIGFEDLNVTTVDVLECKKNAFTCAATPNTLSLEMPVGWSVNFETVNDSSVIRFHEAMSFMTAEEAFDGFRSMELNYRPPKLDVVTEDAGGANPAICDNRSTGFQGSLQTQDLNATIASSAFQFPGDFPALKWASMKADTPRLQYDVNFFGANPFCSPKTLCYGDCNATVRGTYSITLSELSSVDLSVVRTVFRFEGEASNNWSVVNVDLNQSNINSTAPHRITISSFVVNEDLSDIRPKRIFFDNFTIQNLALPLVENCVSTCSGRDLLEATLQNGTCFITTIINESSCNAIIEGQEAEAEFNASLGPVEFILALAGTNSTAIEESGFGFVLFFISPSFIILAILLTISVFAEFKISSAGSSTGGTVFALILLAGTTFFTITGTLPLSFAVIFILIGGFIVLHTFSKTFGGN